MKRFSENVLPYLRDALQTHRALLSILLLALAVRLALWAQPLHEPANDEIEYVAVAYDLLEGRGWQFYEQYHWLRAPLYPLFLAGSLWLSGGDLHLAALPNIALSTATVWLIYLLTREIIRDREHLHPFLSRAPLLAALLAALLLTLGTFASLYMSETLFTFLLTASFLLLLRGVRGQGTGDRGQGWPAHAYPVYPWVAAAGICYGLATLTRSLPLAFLPVVALWIGWVQRGQGTEDRGQETGDRRRLARLGPALLPALFFVVCTALVILPWTLRNCQAYGRCILVETGFSYNLWAFNEPREDPDVIFRTLEQIANPAERADEAARRGMERLQEDPAILLRKLYPNWVYLWRIKPIQDRFLMADYYADPPPLLFLLALVLDDLLYVVLLSASVIGISTGWARQGGRSLLDRLRAPGFPDMITSLLALWVLAVVAITMLTHGEGRYRHFILFVIIPYGAVGMLELARVARRLRENHPWSPASLTSRYAVLWGGRVLLIALLLHTVAHHYPWRWFERGVGRSFYHVVGDIARMTGNVQGAEAAYQRAIRAQRTADIWIALGDLRLEQGDLLGAEAAYRSAWRKEDLYIAASARVGEVTRRQGHEQEAREAFEGNHVYEQNVINWSWRHLPRLDLPPTTTIQVGEGLDSGYVGGMYPAERLQGTQARWTDGRGLLRLAVPAAAVASRLSPEVPQPPVLRLRLAAPRLDGAGAPVAARVCVADECLPLSLAPTWRTFELLLPRDALPPDAPGAGAGQVIELRSPTFRAPDGRRLGVLVDWAAVYP